MSANKAYRKDIFREIKNTAGRFLSLLIITALGAASVVGIQATAIDMRIAADKLCKEREVFDVQIKSTVGFDENDITALQNREDVKTVMPSYVFDVYVYFEEETLSVRTYSLPDELNKIEILSGRYPENSEECVVEESLMQAGNYKIGDKISLGLDDMDKYHDIIKENEFTVAGVISSPLYINNFERGQTALGNGKLDFYLFLNPSAYELEIYTDVYIQAENSLCMDNMTDDYNKSVEQFKDEIKLTGESQVQLKKEKIKDSEKELSEGLSNYTKGKEELETKLAEAHEKLKEAKTSLDSAKSELEKSQTELETYRGMGVLDMQLAAIQAAIDEGWEKYNSGLSEYEKGIKELEEEETGALEELRKAKLELDDAEEKLKNAPNPEWFYFTRSEATEYDSYYQDTLRLEKIGYVFPLVFFLVAIMVSLTTMTRMVEEHRTQIGVYKALGYNTFRIMLKYLVYAFGAGVAGGVSGVFAGSYVFPTIIIDAYSYMYNMPPAETPVPVIIAAIAVTAAAGSVTLVTLLVCVKTSAGVPALLMRPKPPQSGKRVMIERIPFIWKRLSFIGKVTARNIFRYKRRFFMSIAGVAGCSALLLTAFGLRDSIGGVAALQYGKIVNYDLRAYLKEITEELNSCADENVLYIREESVKAQGLDLDVSLIIPESVNRPSDFINLISPDNQNVIDLEEGGVIITEKLAKKTGIYVGGVILVDIEGEEYNVTVSGVAENYILNYIYMPPDLYKELKGTEVVFNSVLIKTDNEAVLTRSLLSDENVRAVLSTKNQTASVADSTDALGIVTVVLIILACALAFVVLFNLTNINITERMRELATIKVLGFYDAELAMYIYRENAAVTLIGIILGLGGGIFLHGFILTSIEIDLLMFPLIINPFSYIIAMILSASFALFVNLIMNFKLAAIDMVGSLKNVE